MLVAGAAVLYLSPRGAADAWPWQLAPLLARAVASWYAMIGAMLLACAWSLRAPAEAVIPYATLLAWSLLLLALPLLHDVDIVRAGAERTTYLVVLAALAALSAFALARALPAARAAGQGL